MRRAAINLSLLLLFACTGESADPPPAQTRTFDSNDPVERACALPKEQLIRLWRGHHPVHSEDVTIVPQEPNYSGSFTVTSHSGPWDYVQTVPLVMYGPGFIPEMGTVAGPASITDVYPTAGWLTMVELPARSGRLRFETTPPAEPPKVIVTVVWDGVGRNVLEAWEGRWPNLERMEREGTSFSDATVGSSPSITPATHSNLGTGDYPNVHGVTAIEYRERSGKVRGAFADRDPRDLKLSTFADEIDRNLGNGSRVGMLAWKSWHLGMMGHGSASEGGDADEVGFLSHKGVTGNDAFFTTPSYPEFGSLEAAAHALDERDGEIDGAWRGHDILEQHDNPAWVRFQTDSLLAMLDGGGYGDDAVPDLFFTNYKPTDIVAHRYGMNSDEMGDVLEAQDAALGELVEWLDREVGDYVVVVTADHGNTPRASETDAWPLLQGQLEDDVNAHFDIADGSLLRKTSAAGPFLNRQVAKDNGVTAADIAGFLNGYTIADNWNEEELPEGYEERGDEHILAAAFASDQYDDVMRCAFGRPRPPQGSDA